jgi:chemotaxis protein MotA
MDFATGIGLVFGVSVVCTLILMGGSFSLYYDIHAVIVIGGGTLAATIIRFPFTALLHGFPMGLRFAFTMRRMHPRDLIDEITKIADTVRRNGPMALENVQVDDTFLAQGIRYIADGYDRDFIKDTMERDRDNFIMRLEEGMKIYQAVGDAAPAWGMIGTLVGMVQMFANMEDPSKLGPFMAVSLLATLYGALVGNLLALPIADKLKLKMEDEDISRSLIIDGILQIRDAKSPTVVREMLFAYLPDHHRHEEAAAA